MNRPASITKVLGNVIRITEKEKRRDLPPFNFIVNGCILLFFVESLYSLQICVYFMRDNCRSGNNKCSKDKLIIKYIYWYATAEQTLDSSPLAFLFSCTGRCYPLGFYYCGIRNWLRVVSTGTSSLGVIDLLLSDCPSGAKLVYLNFFWIVIVGGQWVFRRIHVRRNERRNKSKRSALRPCSLCVK